MDVLFSNGLDHERHQGWAIDVFLTERIRPWTSSCLGVARGKQPKSLAQLPLLRGPKIRSKTGSYTLRASRPLGPCLGEQGTLNPKPGFSYNLGTSVPLGRYVLNPKPNPETTPPPHFNHNLRNPGKGLSHLSESRFCLRDSHAPRRRI